MLYDALNVFETSGGSEDLATSTTSPVSSDYFDMKMAPGFNEGGYADAGHALEVEFYIKSTTAAGGTGFTFAIDGCATSGGTYVEKAARTELLADCVAGKRVRIPIPAGMPQYWKARVTPNGTMTGALTANAAIVVY